jgi:IS30 family transposase
MRREWTHAEEQRFRTLWDAGVSVRDIAKDLGRSETSIRFKRFYSNMKPRVDYYKGRRNV